MKDNKNLKIKILLIGIILIIISGIAYISLPHISYALDSVINNVADTVAKITIPANSTETKKEIQEHRGYGIWAGYHSKSETKNYKDAAGNTGIENIDTFISTYLSPKIAIDKEYGWLWALQYGTSIFCQEHGQTFPSLNGRKLYGFHLENATLSDGSIDTNEDVYSSGSEIKYKDFTELVPDLACEGEINVYLEDYKGGIEPKTTNISEKDILDLGGTGYGYFIKKFTQITTVRVSYKSSPRPFDTVESYIFTYSLRNWYTYNPAQLALWKYKNSYDVSLSDYTYCDEDTIAKAKKLYNSAKAVEELSNPTKPEMSVTSATVGNITYSTGTVLDGDNYKVGPIKMNSYTYGWTEDIKEFSGQSSIENPDNATLLANKTDEQKEFFKGLVAGIIEAKVQLDDVNNTEIILTKDNIIVEGGSTASGSSYYSYPTMADGYEYPTPNSTFYIKLPIKECNGATSIKKITMKYKWHTADGDGGDLTGKFDELTWNTWKTDEQERLYYNSTKYFCTNSDSHGTSCQAEGYIRSTYAKVTNADTNGTSSEEETTNGSVDYNVNAWGHNFVCGGSEYCNDCSDKYDGPTECEGHDTGTIVCGMHHSQSDCGDYWDSSCFDKDCIHDADCDNCAYECNHICDESCADECTHDCAEEGCYYCDHDCLRSCYDWDCPILHDLEEWSVDDHGCYGTEEFDGYCEHGFSDGKHNCYVYYVSYSDTSSEDRNKMHSATHEDCEAKDWGEDHIGRCYGEKDVGTKCVEHGCHRNCMRFYWYLRSQSTEDSQKLMYVSDAQVYEHNVECYLENIPLVAKVEIFKYIYDVEHNEDVVPDGASDNSYVASDARRNLSEATKEANPVYVEADDFVTYKIIMKNSSAFGVKIRIDDVLPEEDVYEFVEAKVGTEKLENIEALREKVIVISANSEASVTVTIQVKALEGKHENIARIITRNGSPKNDDDDIDYIRTEDDDGPVVNHIGVQSNGTTETPLWESSDWFILNNYNTYIDKYLYKYDELVQNENNTNQFTDEDTIVDADDKITPSRVNKNLEAATKQVENDTSISDTYHKLGTNETNKADHPVNVEQRETVTYAIRVVNDATDVAKAEPTGKKTATQIKVTTVTDKLHNGLSYTDSIKATIFKKDDSVKVQNVLGVGCSLVGTDGQYNVYEITTSNTTILEPGEYIEFYMEAEVVQSNMYLYSMDNTAEITTISNINDVVIYDKPEEGDGGEDGEEGDDGVNRLVSEPQSSTEYVRQKDLVISGSVWVDINKDGLIGGETPITDYDKENYNINDEGMKEDVLVKLYRVGKSEPIRTTRTNSDGLYTFARTEDDGDAGWRGTFNHLTQYSDPDGDAYQRVDKASGKDANGNYTAESQPYSYYVEFEYDGVIYKSTVYAGKSRLDNEDDENGYGSITDVKYYIDSNATELTADRETFNTKYEYISYNVAYGYTDNTYDLTASSDLSFEKQGHESYLNEDPSRAMTAKSFVNVEDQEIEYLWLYPLDSDNKIPETEYLKYINLGLELREDVDLALTKDVYNLKTTINGEEMEYDYNLGDTDGYLNDYVVKKPYGFEIYESDYKYRVEQYLSEAVEAYKGANGEDELNIEITYRISLQNLTTRDDEVLAQTDAHKDNERIANNTQLNVKVHEVLDLYDENFIKDVSQVITVKVRDAEGFLKDKQIKAGEAWMFMEKSEAGDRELLENGEIYAQRASNGGTKPIYVPYDKNIHVNEDGSELKENQLYVKVKLDISNESIFTDKTNDFTADGYTTAYISGMGDQVITEGGDSLDIYVKYVVDKDELKIDVDATYDETKTSTVKIYNEETKEIETLRIENNDVKTVITNVTEKEETTIEGEETTKYTATIARAIKLAEKTNTEFKAAAKGGRGTENIAQINAYSVWYTDGKPASLVDKDSNAGNIGITSSEDGTTSADNIEFYEDMTYKTGIELVAENTENTEEDLEEKYPGEKDENSIGIIGLIRPIRKIKGTIWDDSRTQILTENVDNDHQYIGDGYLDTTKTKLAEAKSNENVRLNYKDESVTEDNDIAVRSAKAEFIEIIQVDDTHYYEEVLTHVTWPQVQNVRTDTNGAYTLNGFKPGRYIVRFTYGDTTENTEQYPNAKEDMLIFNGQDYKSTQYTGVSDSLETVKDADAIIKAIEVSGSNDARDDEVRRLEVNAYSEVMTNEIAEILKGLANDERELTPNSTPNTPAELQALTDNTYMTADTREFLVKAEKLTPSQTTSYTGKTIEELYYMALEAMKNEHIEARDFTINNVDLGIEYRPESQISLMKEIRQIKLTTEDNEVLVDLHFKTNEDGSERYHEIIKDESTGYELVQFITNNYTTKPLINNIISEEYVQGLVYIQIDEELLQGCTIEITYGFEAQNSSEIDRVSKKLNAIRYRDNKATDDLIKAYGDKYGNPDDEANYKPELLLDLFNVTNTRYTASALSKAVVNLDTYKVDKTQEVLTEGEEPTTSEEDNKYIVYRTIPKTTTTDGEDGYFGRYVGHSYYTGKLLDEANKPIGLDTIASLKFDKILDYIDTNLEYEQKTKAKDLTNRMWSKITSKELVSLVSHYKDYRQLLDVEGATAADFPVVTNIDGVEYKSMVVSIDDRNVDPGDDNDTGDVKNIELSKFLLPKVSVVGLDKNDDYGKELDEEGKIGYDDYTGSILLDTSKVLAAGSADDDKTYENMAEIVQFTTQTGRRTNFATTIGNADIHAIEEKLENKEPPFDGTTGSNSGSIEFITASIEPDTSATETITLIPPTGLMKNRRAIVSIMETAKTGVEVMSMTGLVVAIIAVAVIVVLFVIRKYKKRRIK